MNRHTHYNTAELNTIQFSSVVVAADAAVKKHGRTAVALCPLHDDHHPSMSIYESNGENHAFCHVCRERLTPISYVMAKKSLDFPDACEWLSSRFHITCDEHCSGTSMPRKKRKTFKDVCCADETKARNSMQQGELPTISTSFVNSHVSSGNSLCQCLGMIYPKEDVERITQLYRLGAYSGLSRPDDVLFPSITHDGKVLNIKVQSYPIKVPSAPGFLHNDKEHCFWLASILQQRGELPKDARFSTDCLFGEHLLDNAPDATVCLVESPKNAVIGALEFPEYLWLATGSMGQFKPSVAKCLRHRNVIVIPDCNAITLWSQRAEQMRHLARFTICTASQLLNTDGSDKADFADQIIAERLAKGLFR